MSDQTPAQKLLSDLVPHIGNKAADVTLVYLLAKDVDGHVASIMVAKDDAYVQSLFESLACMVRTLTERGLQKDDLLAAVSEAYDVQAGLILAEDEEQN